MQRDTSSGSGVAGIRSRLAFSGAASRVTTFELFFDLVFVFAFTQVSRLMAETHSVTGVLEALLVLGLLWWTWGSYGWLGNQAAADRGAMQVGMSLAMIAMFVAALSIPEAYEDLPGGWNGPLVLALAYAIVRVIHLLLYTAAAGDDRTLRRRVLRTLPLGMTPAIIALIAGALIGGAAQPWIWLAAFLWDIVIVWLGSHSGGGWKIHSSEYWAERHGLVVILALGESIVAIGVGVSREPIDGVIVLGSALAVTISILLWWSYFSRIAAAGEAAIERRTDAARVGLAVNAYSYVHLPLVAGVVLAALGVEEAMAHIHDSEGFGWFGAASLGAGVAVYLAATAAFARLVDLGWSAWRLAGVVALLGFIPLLAVVPPMLALAVVAGVLAAALAAEGLSARTATAETQPG